MEMSYTVDQVVDPSYWQMQIKPTITTQFSLASNFEIARILQQTWDFDLKSFKADIYYSFLFSTKGQVCMGLGYDLASINFKLVGDIIFKNCYKTIFYDICDSSSSWTGQYAQWIEDCSDSTKATATIMDTSYAAVNQQNVLGGIVPDGRGCFQFAQWSDWAPYAAQAAYATASYMAADL